jgi:hypothetical protein
MTIPGLDLKTLNASQASIKTTKFLMNSPPGSESKMSKASTADTEILGSSGIGF